MDNAVTEFINFHKQKLERERNELLFITKHFLKQFPAEKELSVVNSAHLNPASSAFTPKYDIPMIKVPKNRNQLYFKDDEPVGLVLGGYEEKRKKLAQERRTEYNAFLVEKEKQSNIRKISAQYKRNAIAAEHYLPMNYQEMVQKRKEEEKQYRNINYFDGAESLIGNGVQDRLHAERQQYEKAQMDTMKIAVEAPAMPTSPARSYQRFATNVPEIAHPVPLNGLYTHFAPKNLLPSSAPSKHQDNAYNHLHLSSRSSADNNISGFPFESRPKDRTSQYNYMKDLEQQVIEKQLQKLKEEEIESRKQQPIEYFPWTNRTGGGGAPIRDSSGNVITSRKGVNAVVLPSYDHPLGIHNPQDSIPAVNTMATTSLIQNEFVDSQRKLDHYRDDLRKQIEEKKRLNQLEKEKELLEEKMLAERIEEQRLRMQREYEEEKAKRIRKEEEHRLKQERLMELEELRIKEAEQKRKEAEEKKKKMKSTEVTHYEPEKRTPSPPVPAVRTLDVLEKAKFKDPAPGMPKEVTSIHPNNVLSQLSELRQLVQKEQLKMDSMLKEEKKTYKVMNRRAVQDDTDDDDEELYQPEGHNDEFKKNSFEVLDKSYDQSNKENIKGSDKEVESLYYSPA